MAVTPNSAFLTDLQSDLDAGVIAAFSNNLGKILPYFARAGYTQYTDGQTIASKVRLAGYITVTDGTLLLPAVGFPGERLIVTNLATAATCKLLPNAGQTINGMASYPLLHYLASVEVMLIGPTWVVLNSTPGVDRVLAANATTVVFGNLDSNSDETYVLRWRLLNPTGGTATVRLHFNGDTVDANYEGQALFANGAVGTPLRTNTAILFDMPTTEGSSGKCEIARVPLNGRIRAISQDNYDAFAVVKSRVVNLVHTTANLNLTSITLTSSAAGGLAAGGRVRLSRS